MLYSIYMQQPPWYLKDLIHNVPFTSTWAICGQVVAPKGLSHLYVYVLEAKPLKLCGEALVWQADEVLQQQGDTIYNRWTQLLNWTHPGDSKGRQVCKVQIICQVNKNQTNIVN